MVYVHQYRIFKHPSKSVPFTLYKNPVNETQSLEVDIGICLSLIYYELLLLQEIRRKLRTKFSKADSKHSERVFRNIRTTLKLQLQYRRDEILEQLEVKTGSDRSQILLEVFPAPEIFIRKNLQKIVAAILDFYKITFFRALKLVGAVTHSQCWQRPLTWRRPLTLWMLSLRPKKSSKEKKKKDK